MNTIAPLTKEACERIRARMQKEAGLPKVNFGTLFSGMRNPLANIRNPFAGASVPRPAAIAAGVGGAAALGVGGAGTVQHLQNNANANNFEHNTQQLNNANVDLQSQLNTARTAGNHTEATRLHGLIDSGNHGGSFANSWNPWGTAPASYYQQNAQRLQGAEQNRLNAARSQQSAAIDPTILQNMQQRLASGNLLPHQARLLQQQINDTRAQQMAQRARPANWESPEATRIRANMLGQGMRVQDPAPQSQQGYAPARHGPPAQHLWDQNTVNHNAINNGDYRGGDVWGGSPLLQ